MPSSARSRRTLARQIGPAPGHAERPAHGVARVDLRERVEGQARAAAVAEGVDAERAEVARPPQRRGRALGRVPESPLLGGLELLGVEARARLPRAARVDLLATGIAEAHGAVLVEERVERV